MTQISGMRKVTHGPGISSSCTEARFGVKTDLEDLLAKVRIPSCLHPCLFPKSLPVVITLVSPLGVAASRFLGFLGFYLSSCLVSTSHVVSSSPCFLILVSCTSLVVLLVCDISGSSILLNVFLFYSSGFREH